MVFKLGEKEETTVRNMLNLTLITVVNFSFLDDVMVSACSWARDYIKNSQEVEKSDKHLCDRIETTN